MKTEVRAALLKRRSALAERAKRDGRIAGRLTKLLTECIAGRVGVTVGFYFPLRSEPDLREPLFAWAEEKGAVPALPAVKGRDMVYRRAEKGTELVPDDARIPAPFEDAEPVEPEILIAPCAGYSGAGHRLGYGGGYFDRYLGRSSVRPLVIGVAYDELRAEPEIFESFDERLDFAVTEARVLRFRK